MSRFSSSPQGTDPAVISTGYISPNPVSASNGTASDATDGDLGTACNLGFGENLVVDVNTISVIGVRVNFSYIDGAGTTYEITSSDGTTLVSETLAESDEGTWFSFLFDGLYKELTVAETGGGALEIAEIEVEREILPEHIHTIQ